MNIYRKVEKDVFIIDDFFFFVGFYMTLNIKIRDIIIKNK